MKIEWLHEQRGAPSALAEAALASLSGVGKPQSAICLGQVKAKFNFSESDERFVSVPPSPSSCKTVHHAPLLLEIPPPTLSPKRGWSLCRKTLVLFECQKCHVCLWVISEYRGGISALVEGIFPRAPQEDNREDLAAFLGWQGLLLMGSV